MSEENGGGEHGYGDHSYVVMVWSPTGYTLAERSGGPPRVGDEFEDNGRTLVVSKVGVSPLPGDTRPCAFSVGKA